MLSAAPFYYQTIRNNVIAFGDIFKDIMLLKYNANNRVEIDRRIVPLVYMPKENYISRLNNTQDEDLPNKVEIVLPTMSFEITKIAYDPTRKLQSSLQNFNTISGTNSQIATQYVGVPYNINFSLYIYIRNIDDGLQIIEQILPFFNPDYTLTMNFIPSMNIVKNIPLTLNDVNMDNTWEGDAQSEERRLVWTLDFTLQSYLFGPTTTGGIIKTSTANIVYYNYSTTDQDELVLTTANTPLGNFMLGETIYQGPDLPDANATATVDSWSYKGGQLSITVTGGAFVPNVNVYGSMSGASVEVLSVPPTTVMASVVVTPVPANANIGSDFGFLTSIEEFPAIT